MFARESSSDLIRNGILIGILFLAFRFAKYLSGSQLSYNIDLIESKQKPSYTDSQYAIFADTIENAISGVGTSEDDIKSVMNKMMSDKDVLKLIVAFGERSSYLSSGNLTIWLRGDLDNQAMETYVNAPLRAKGIKYQF